MKHLLPLPLLFCLCACGPEDGAFDPPARVSIPPEAVTASFGEMSDASGTEILSSPWVAALSESGRYLAVGDRAPPFLRILDRETGAARAFGPEGQGPGELMSAYGLDFVGDSTLLVLSAGQRLDRFNVEGEWVGGQRLRETGVLVMSITVACGSRIFAYGVPFGYRQMDTVPWLHELAFATGVSTEERLRIPGRGYRVGFGGLYGLDGNEDGVLLWHRAREPQLGYWLPCEGGVASVWSHTASREIVEQRITLDGGDYGGSVLVLPDTLFHGAAAFGSTKIRARFAFKPGDGIPVTRFHTVQGELCREVDIFGGWRLHDAHRDGLVVSAFEPYPIVQVIDWEWFRASLTRVKCSG